jgi:hypothetical protein
MDVALQSVGLLAHVVARPQGPELLALQRELAHQVGQVRIVEIGADGGAQDGHGVPRHLVPVRVDLACGGIEEDQPDQVLAA